MTSPRRCAPTLLLTLLCLIPLAAGCGSGGGAPDDAGVPAAPVATERTADPALGAHVWQLEAAGEIGEEEALAGDAPITLALSAEGGASGSSGCNRFSTTYRLDGRGGITFGAVASTRMACAEDVMQREQDFLTWLASVTSYEVGADQLMLFYDETTKALLFGVAPESASD